MKKHLFLKEECKLSFHNLFYHFEQAIKIVFLNLFENCCHICSNIFSHSCSHVFNHSCSCHHSHYHCFSCSHCHNHCCSYSNSDNHCVIHINSCSHNHNWSHIEAKEYMFADNIRNTRNHVQS